MHQHSITLYNYLPTFHNTLSPSIALYPFYPLNSFRLRLIDTPNYYSPSHTPATFGDFFTLFSFSLSLLSLSLFLFPWYINYTFSSIIYYTLQLIRLSYYILYVCYRIRLLLYILYVATYTFSVLYRIRLLPYIYYTFAIV